MLPALGLVAACAEPTIFTPEPPTLPVLRLPMNNAYVGSIHAGPGFLRPKFAWEASTTDAAGTLRYELQVSQDSSFKSGVTTFNSEEPSYQPDEDLSVSLHQPVGARYFWRVRSCIRNSCSEYTPYWYVNVGRAIKDYNGDGYSDAAVGAPGSDSLSSESGRVFVYFGGSGGGLDNVADWTLVTTNEGSGYALGAYLGSGDFNGDGFADLVMGSPMRAGKVLGQAYLYYGGVESSLDSFSDGTLTDNIPNDSYGLRVGSLGDFNGDGADDLYVTAGDASNVVTHLNVYLGTPQGRVNNQIDAVFPAHSYGDISAGGDLNGDGISDLVIGNRNDSTQGSGAGGVAIFFGVAGDIPDTTVDGVMFGRGEFDGYGAGLSSRVDVNGDGFADLFVANFRDEDSALDESGSVDLFFGGPDKFDAIVDAMMKGATGNDEFGTTITGVGDVNGDGFEDVLISARMADNPTFNAGFAYLFFGGEGREFDTQAKAVFAGVGTYAAMGEHASGGDLNGDGLSDIMIGSAGYSGNLGRLDVFMGNRSAISSSPSTSLFGTMANDYFSNGLASSREATGRRSVASELCRMKS